MLVILIGDYKRCQSVIIPVWAEQIHTVDFTFLFLNLL